jgi:hypothetical protein
MIGERGVIYVASQQLGFVCEAIASAESVKERVKELPISLMTDIPAVAGRLRLQPFDSVISIDTPLPREAVVNNNESWARGVYTKLVGLRQSPYAKTLYLDSDTRVLCSDLTRMFDYLEGHSIAMAPCTPMTSRDCFLCGPMFNTGVIGYRLDPDVIQLFLKWDAIHHRHLEIAYHNFPVDLPYLAHLSSIERRQMLLSDQVSLAQLLAPSTRNAGVSVKVLDEAWNARDRPRDELQNVIVDHANCHKIPLPHVAGFFRDRGIAMQRVS